MMTPTEVLESELVGQYLLIHSDQTFALPSWNRRRLADWTLLSCEPLPVVELVNSRGEQLGWVLGIPIHDSTGFFESKIVLPIEVSDGASSVQSALADWLDETNGRYLVVLITSDVAEVYPDAGAFLPAYYCSRSGAVSSSPQLAAAVTGPEIRDEAHESMCEAMNIPDADNWFPFGLTPCPSVSRLLPNHCLNLPSRVAERRWSPSGQTEMQLAEAVEAIGGYLSSQVGHILERSPAYLSLTAGYDSRMVLAACRSHAERVTAFTVDSDPTDVAVAKQLAAIAGLNHITQQRLPSAPGSRETWLARTGYTIAGAGLQSLRRQPELESDHAVLGGFGGELSRGFLWPSVSSMDAQLTAEELVTLLELPPSPRVIRAGEQWLAQLPPTLSIHDVLDLAFVEQRLGCCASPQQLANPTSAGRFHPLAHRKIIKTVFALAARHRGGPQVAEGVIEILWPELMQVPFNPRPLKNRIMAAAYKVLPASIQPLAQRLRARFS